MEKTLSQEIISERLSLRPVAVADVEALHSLWTDEGVRRFLWDGEVIPLSRTREIVEKSRSMSAAHGFGIWGIRERGSDEILGFTGFWHFRTPPSLELLFGVASSHWNRGIATESSRCLIRYAFGDMGFPSVEASTDSGNEASIRVLAKLGMAFQRREVGEGLDTLFYGVTRIDWQNAS